MSRENELTSKPVPVEENASDKFCACKQRRKRPP